jgi:DNA-binding MarR family transcriptional regulator
VSERRIPSWSPSVLFDVHALDNAVGTYLDRALADSPLNPATYAFYSAIFDAEQISPTALASFMGMPLTTVMDRLAAAERAGHISRHPDPRDRRATVVVLTGAGLAAHRAANALFERAYAVFIAALPVSAADASAMLERLREAVDAARIELEQLAVG